MTSVTLKSGNDMIFTFQKFWFQQKTQTKTNIIKTALLIN